MSFVYHKLSTFHLKTVESNRQLYESRVKHSQRSENGMKHCDSRLKRSQRYKSSVIQLYFTFLTL